MKKILVSLIITFSIISFFYGCDNNNTSESHVGDVIINKIEKSYGNFLSEDTLINGDLFYSITLKGKERLKNEKEITNFIDKSLKKIPDVLIKNELSSNGKYLFNLYKWNTPELGLKMESSFFITTGNRNDSVYIRLWMNKK